MELVYLWVEKYKNIHEQGFNFSPRFTCVYDKEKNELTIDENDDYIPDFFGENINVTTIVGKNGSGKSSIFEIITTFSFQEYFDKKTFLVFFNGKSFSFKQSYTGEELDFEITNKTKYLHSSHNASRRVNALYFGNELSTIFNNPRMKSVQLYEGNIDAFKDEKFALNNKKYFTEKRERVYKFEIFNKRFHFLLNRKNNIFKKIDSVIVFDSFRRELHFYEMISLIAGNISIMKLVGDKNLTRNTILETPIEDKKYLFYKLLIVFRLYQCEYNETRKESAPISGVRTAQKVKDIVEEINKDFTSKDFTNETFLKISKVINSYDHKKDIYSKKNIEDILTKYEYTDNEIWIEKDLTSIDISIEIENPLLELLNINNIVRVDFLNSSSDSYNYFSLSSGERNYIEIFVTYLYHLISENKKEKYNRKIFFLFDEIDLGLHPSWQKRLIRDIIDFANEYFKDSIHFVFTSHSPFLLSDIPKQNIIFLDKDEKGNCKVVDGLKEKKQTFGANIHTLLSDSFFMEDGLMGEFAKGKINKAIVLLNKENLDEEELKYCEQIISIIGEPIVKNQLQRMLDSKRLSKIDAVNEKIKNMSYELEILKKHQSKIIQDELRDKGKKQYKQRLKK